MIAFQQPWFLLGLAGLAVPVLLHLISRELARPLEFPSIRFLQKAQLPRRERRRLRDLLLLFLRMLLYALLVLSFARPFWKSDTEVAPLADSIPLDVYLVDSSWSMGRPGIQEAVRKEVLQSVGGDETSNFAVSAFAKEEMEHLPAGSDEAALHEFLDRLDVSPTAGRPDRALEAAISRWSAYPGKVKLHVVSDFQDSDWLRELPELPDDWELEALQVEPDAVADTAIVGVRTFPVGSDIQRVQVWLRQTGEAQTLTLGLYDEQGSLLETREVAMEGNSEDYLLFDVAAAEPRACELRLKGDAYEGDNSWRFWVPTPPRIRVLALLPNFDEPASAQAFYFMQTALEVKSEVDWLGFEVEAFDRAFLDPDVLVRADVLVIPASSAYFNDADWDLIKQYIEEGGKVWFLPGDDFPRQFRALIQRELLDARFAGLVGNLNERQRPFHPELPEHSGLAEVFRGEAVRDLYLAQVYQYVRLQGVPEGDVWMSNEQGDPLIISRAVGHGRVWINTFALDTRWTDLPLRNAFLPLVREVVQEDFDAQAAFINYYLGEDGERMPALVPLKPDWIEEEGVYYSFNINPSEFATKSLDGQARLSALRSGMPSETAVNASLMSADASSARPEWWVWLLLGALACFFMETLVAARGSRGYEPEVKS